MNRRKLLLSGLLLIVIGSSLCVYLMEYRAVPIGNLLATPGDYESNLLTIGGEVKERMSILGLKYYTLSDGTGEIRVITEKALPEKGVTLRVKGKVEEAFSLGDMQVLVFVEEKPN
jgi:hypothetical protein